MIELSAVGTASINQTSEIHANVFDKMPNIINLKINIIRRINKMIHPCSTIRITYFIQI